MTTQSNGRSKEKYTPVESLNNQRVAAATAQPLFSVAGDILRAILRQLIGIKSYLGSLAVSLLALAVAFSISALLNVEGPSRVFLVAVLISAMIYGLWPALFASLICALAYDYFFLPPIYSFAIVTSEGLTDFCLFVITAITVTALTTRVRRHALAAEARALTAEKLSAFTRCLAEALTTKDMLDSAAEKMSALLRMPVALALAEGGTPNINALSPAQIAPDVACLRTAFAWWALQPEEDGSELVVDAWRFQNLRGAGESLGLIATKPLKAADSSPAQRQLLDALAYQTALALERNALRDRFEKANMLAETERLRANVLTSISHDLCNPLAAILASASVLEQGWESLAETSKRQMASTMRDEAARLDAFIHKLLDMTRIEAGAIRPCCRPISVAYAVEAALQRASAICAGHCVVVDIPAALPLVEADPSLLQQVLYNVIENAAKYTPSGTMIQIVTSDHGHLIHIAILDEGPGIATADLERVFEKFYRAQNTERRRDGSGLGLAICRAFTEVMNGSIEVATRTGGRGAAFTIILPVSARQEIKDWAA